MYKDLTNVQINVHLFYNHFQYTKFNYNIAQFGGKNPKILI